MSNKKDKALVVKQPIQPAPATPEALVAQAIASGASVDVVERILALKERIDANRAKEAFNSAMAAFQAECPVIKKTKSVKTNDGTVAYTYAPLDSIVSQVKSLIQKHGFRYSTSMELRDSGVKAVCRVVHLLGYSEETPMDVPLGTKTNIMSQSQVVAAAQTFAKRYAFCNAFGIMTSDTDESGVVKAAEDTQKLADKVIAMAKQMTGKQLTETRAKIEGSKKYDDEQKAKILNAIDNRLGELMDKEAEKI